MDLVSDATLTEVNTTYVPGEVMARTRYERCRWERVGVVGAEDATLAARSAIREVEFVRCRTDVGWRMSNVVLDSVVWERPRGEIWLRRCAFRHVRLSGPFSMLWVDQDVRLGKGAEIVAQNKRFHAEVDWCVDVREAEIRDGVFRGMDPAKVIVDPGRQAFVTFDAARRGRHLIPEREVLPGVVSSQVRIAADSDRHGVLFLSVFSKGKHAAGERELIAAFREAGLTSPTYDGPT